MIGLLHPTIRARFTCLLACWLIILLALAGCGRESSRLAEKMGFGSDGRETNAPPMPGGDYADKKLEMPATKGLRAAGGVMAKDVTTTSTTGENDEQPSDGEDKPTSSSAMAATGVKLPARRYIVRSAAIKLEVAAVARALDILNKLAVRFKGFASDSNLDTESSSVPSGTITLRVPADSLDETVEMVVRMGTVLSKAIKGQDITSEFVDTSARLRNKRKEEEMYLKLMSQSTSVKEILPVAKELARVRGEIEATQGALQHMAGLVDLATITITLEQKEITPPATDLWDFGARWSNAWQGGVQRLASTIGDLVAALAGLLTMLPLLLGVLAIYLLVGWLIGMLVVRRLQLLSGRTYVWVWLAVGYLGLGIEFPILFGLLAGLAIILFVAWLGHVVYRRFTRSRGQE